MSTVAEPTAYLRHADRLYIGGEWVKPASESTIDVIDSGTEQLLFRVAEANAADMSHAVSAARDAFDRGPWPRMTHGQRAEHLRALANEVRKRNDAFAQLWPRQSGVLHAVAATAGQDAADTFEHYASLAETFPWEEEVAPSAGEFGLLVREPVGVVGAIIPWNAPSFTISYKLGPALIAGCTVVLKLSPEAPGEGYLVAEAA
jgi:aldehyde dehydrogenase (NAD+)